MRSERVPPRVLVDTNLWVTFLLPSAVPDRPIVRLLECIREGTIVLIVPDDLITELEDTIGRKPNLSRRIPLGAAGDLVKALLEVRERVTAVTLPVPHLTRDPKDDYLIVAAIEGDVDILVSGDADLLVLRDHLERPRIMTARELVDELDRE